MAIYDDPTGLSTEARASYSRHAKRALERRKAERHKHVTEASHDRTDVTSHVTPATIEEDLEEASRAGLLSARKILELRRRRRDEDGAA